jgi:hypothetical protein
LLELVDFIEPVDFIELDELVDFIELDELVVFPADLIDRMASTRHMYSPAPFPKCGFART